VSREDFQEAQRRIRDAVAQGTITADEGDRRAEAVVHAVTPHDLYEMSGGLAGEAHMSRAARREWTKVAWVFVAMALVAIAMLVVLILVLA
jgi:Domain of unknown function (DUF1707)